MTDEEKNYCNITFYCENAYSTTWQKKCKHYKKESLKSDECYFQDDFFCDNDEAKNEAIQNKIKEKK